MICALVTNRSLERWHTGATDQSYIAFRYQSLLVAGPSSNYIGMSKAHSRTLGLVVWLPSVRTMIPPFQTVRLTCTETPWITNMSPSTKISDSGSVNTVDDPNPPTTAVFSPTQNSSSKRQRKTILVHQKSPLLIATPPQVTRALAFSHPFLLPLNKFLGLISWSSGDPWESFLLVAGFWAVVLFGDDITRFAGPIIAVASLIAGMYSRRYSPLSTTAVTGEKVKGHKKQPSEGSIRHQKSLDDIVDTMNAFTGRCNIMLEPLLELTDFLSTQQSATSATTRPALTTLFIRFLMFLPIWIALTLPPLRIVTTRRVVLVVGTLFLTWHCRPARISRTILWRSLTVRKIVSVITGLTFVDTPAPGAPDLPPRDSKSQLHAASSVASSSRSAGDSVRFTFTVYENQRRWLGLGWTSSMFAYERAPWTDEHLNPAPRKEEFQLPAVDGGDAVWRWVLDSEWRTEGSVKSSAASTSSKTKSDGWIYYDNKVGKEQSVEMRI